MTEKTWRVHPAAIEELHRAADWYESERVGLASDFLEAYEIVYASARRGPVTGTALKIGPHQVRRMLLGRFPFTIVIAELETENVILAVAHVRRRPLYWQHRLAAAKPPSTR